MTDSQESKEPLVDAIEEVQWGEDRKDNLGYKDESDRYDKRGLEDWEMVEYMSEKSDHKIPYWFFALFIILLLVAIGLTFPFWGVRPGFERPWFDWGIPAGAAWVISMAAVIYYLVDYRVAQEEKKEQQEKDKVDRKTADSA